MAKKKEETYPGYEGSAPPCKAAALPTSTSSSARRRTSCSRRWSSSAPSLSPAGFEEFNYHRLTGKGLTVQELTEAVEAMPMMSQSTFVTVTDMDVFKLDEAQRTALVSLLEDFPEYCTLVFLYRQLPYKKDGKLKKAHRRRRRPYHGDRVRPPGPPKAAKVGASPLRRLR